MIKAPRRIDMASQEALLSIPCVRCYGASRLYGIEADPASITSQIFTYECSQCGEEFARTVPRSLQPIQDPYAFHKIS
jgi:hypothetical protein